ncbi:site-specific DNA-methyltransferase [Duganella sp. FT109W]|uniref:Methyltransferase n=2 Tax=Duganella margarita TaxID=2692170 RepID=A0ABW9WNE9_9BURK|nr:site-specific DNA-methyltransferase [Duganella margarita]
MKTLPDNSVDSVVTDPPYGIRFMGKAWDGADIEARADRRRSFASHAPDAGPNGGHKSIAAEAGKYDLAPAAMRAFQQFSEEWAREAFRVLKPGGHLLSFSSPRTFHRMACGIEDAGFEIRDQIMWVFGSGFPKSMNVAKAIESGTGRPKDIRRMQMGEDYSPSGRGPGDYDYPGQETMNGTTAPWVPFTEAAKEWEGWGTALKPAHEPICVARKPLSGTVVANVLLFSTGALNIDACRVEPTGESRERAGETSQDQRYTSAGSANFAAKPGVRGDAPEGRWPANLIHDGSEEALSMFPQAPGQQASVRGSEPSAKTAHAYGEFSGRAPSAPRGDSGSAARFFYCAKASRQDRNEGLPSSLEPAVSTDATMRACEDADWTKRNGNHHPTVKPTDLMAYLVRLMTTTGGTVLDPFMGSGSTGKACMREGMQFIGIEMEPDYLKIAEARVKYEIGAVARRAEEAALVAKAASQQKTIFELDGI